MADVALDRPSLPSGLAARALSALLYAYPVFVLLIVWEAIAYSGAVSPLLWPTLEKVAVDVRNDFGNDFAHHHRLLFFECCDGHR